MQARTRTGSVAGTQAQRRRRADAAARRWLRIDRNSALRMSPAELRSAFALVRSDVVVLDYEEAVDPGGLDRDEVATEDMDGEEIDADKSDAPDADPDSVGYLVDSGDLRLEDASGPFLDLQTVYALSVVPREGLSDAWCHFEPPAWFGQVRRGERPKVWRIASVIGALAEVLSEDFGPFLSDPCPRALGECEWQFVDSSGTRVEESVLLRKGLVRRLNRRLDAAERVDAAGTSGLLPHVWLLWPFGGPSDCSQPQPLLMPLTAIYERSFRIQAAASLCAGGFTGWTLRDAQRPGSWDRASQARRPFRTLDQRERLHLLADVLRIRPGDLLARVLELAGAERPRGAADRGNT